MLAMLQDNAWREPQCWRFTVRCDRATNAAIERAARAAGMSVNAFVQAHFDRILDTPAQPGGAAFDATTFAQRHGVSLSAAALWGLMKAECNAEGLVSRSYVALARTANQSPSTVQNQMEMLIEAGLVSLVRRGQSLVAPSLFRVAEPG